MKKRLILKKETIRRLTTDEMSAVAGGWSEESVGPFTGAKACVVPVRTRQFTDPPPHTLGCPHPPTWVNCYTLTCMPCGSN
jgi:hypothetical protein